MQLRHIAALAALLLASPAWAVHKCKNEYGSTIYQEKPCASNAQQLELKLQPVPETTPEEAAFNRAIAQGQVAVGMTAAQVTRSWGRPSKINVTSTTRSRSEQWIYDRGNFRAQYVYLENGVVRSIQSPSE